MDIRCPKCGEPWDYDELHEEVAARQHGGTPWRDPDGTYHQDVYDKFFKPVLHQFQREGCKVFGTSHNDPVFDEVGPSGLTASETAAVLYDLLGDDMDGAAAMLEDEGF